MTASTARSRSASRLLQQTPEVVRQNKFLLSIGTNIPAQAAIADFL